MEELYDIQNDPGCLNNLAENPAFEDVLIDHRNRLQVRLDLTHDPRVVGNGDIWEEYVRYSPIREFPEPDWKK
jgi:N-sulfoglucosamine sulfohydrolase